MAKHVSGFTLVEVIVSMFIVSGVALSVGAATGSLVHFAAGDRVRTQATAAAQVQLERIQVWPEYLTIDSAFAGTASNTPMTGWTRVTEVVQYGGPNDSTIDYKKVTVTISAPGLTPPVTRSLTIAAPK